MRMSKALIPTLRDNPAEAEIVSHQLLMRGGYIRKGAAGLYTYMPLAKRVLRKVEEIIREEMDAADGQELLMPIVQPAELWLETGRWHVYGDEMFRIKDRHGRDFCLGPTHEEMITDVVRNEVSSYRQLPLRLYQIQNKYRDERRPRFGLIRGREFIMKDLYSFDKDEAGLDESYKAMYDAYTRVFDRCGLKCRPVEADGGAIGGSGTHEFMALADIGEATIVYCDQCDYAANIEIAPAQKASCPIEEPVAPLEKIDTPNAKTIQAVAELLDVSVERCFKTLFFKADEELIVVLARGDHEVNDVKVQNIHPCYNLEMAEEEEVVKLVGCQFGSLGPVGLKGIKIYADFAIQSITNGVCGANENDKHFIGVNPDRDFQVEGYYDLRMLKDGEPCPHCGNPLQSARGIEVGQVFKLGTKYSEVLNATYLDDNGKERVIHMGCYGIGVSRTVAAAVEQNHDENGIIWPKEIAPYHVVVVPISVKDQQQMEIAERLYHQLTAQGIEAVLDDRDERPGVKFKDADLIGYPVRLTVGKKTIESNVIEYKLRTAQGNEEVPIQDVVERVVTYIKQ